MINWLQTLSVRWPVHFVSGDLHMCSLVAPYVTVFSVAAVNTGERQKTWRLDSLLHQRETGDFCHATLSSGYRRFK